MPIYVTKSTAPQFSELEESFQDIVHSRKFSNNGPYVQKLESALLNYLNLNHILLQANGTLSIQIAIRSLALEGKKIITTPFSYVATLSALLWEKCDPIFVDIDAQTLCIEPDEVEKHITPDVCGILPVHVFGNACDVDGFEKLSKKYDIPVFYDAAHAFGCTYANKSLYSYGDCSIASFHATKLFHTGEGGAIFCNNSSIQSQARLLSQFGHIGDNHYSLGINTKLSELHAAVGLHILPKIEAEIEARKKIREKYNSLLKDLPLRTQIIRENLQYNYSYYPIIFQNEKELLSVKSALEEKSIFPRRYFYPSLNTLPYLNTKVHMPVSENIANCIMCLPLYGELSINDVENISQIIHTAFNQNNEE